MTIETLPFVQFADETQLVVRCQTVFDETVNLTITLDDVATYFAEEACNISSGCRTIAGLTGDWRPIDQLAQLALEWFKRVNVEGMRVAARSRHRATFLTDDKGSTSVNHEIRHY